MNWVEKMVDYVRIQTLLNRTLNTFHSPQDVLQETPDVRGLVRHQERELGGEDGGLRVQETS
jgi:hypothetical protein